MNQISNSIATAKTLTDFQKLIVEHENLVGNLIKSEPVKQKYFPDFNGEIKSLGAWGGDFYLVATAMQDRDVLNYFKRKGLRVVFPWREIVLNKQ